MRWLILRDVDALAERTKTFNEQLEIHEEDHHKDLNQEELDELINLNNTLVDVELEEDSSDPDALLYPSESKNWKDETWKP